MDEPISIYHIVHIDRLESILNCGGLYADSALRTVSEVPGSDIGISRIKERRRNMPVRCRPGLMVGDCMPFYFCSRSVMLYLLNCSNNRELPYRGGQQSIIHLRADLHATVAWADRAGSRWAFTTGNAATAFTQSYCSLSELGNVSWESVRAQSWVDCRDENQAEFLLERFFPWELVEEVGVFSEAEQSVAVQALEQADPLSVLPVTVRPNWYY